MSTAYFQYITWLTLELTGHFSGLLELKMTFDLLLLAHKN